MAKCLFSMRISTGNQTFSSREEFHSFLSALNTAADSPVNLLLQSKQNQTQNGTLILQNYHPFSVGGRTDFVITKIFNDEQDATVFSTWLTQGEGKAIADALMKPLDWYIEAITQRPLSDEEFARIMATA